MLQHPIYKLGIRELLEEKGTFIFLLFVASIVVLLMVLKGVLLSSEGSIYSKDDAILVVTNAMAPRYPLPMRYVDEIKDEIDSIEGVAPYNYVPATFNGDRRTVPVVASNARDMIMTNTDLIVPKSLMDNWIDDPSGLIIGETLAKRLKIKLGDSISLTSDMFTASGGKPIVKFRVKATYKVKDEIYPAYTLFIHDRLIRPDGQMTTLQGANSILVRLKDREDATRISAKIDTLFDNRAIQTRSFLRDQYAQSFRNQGKGIRDLIITYGYSGVVVAIVLMFAFSYYHCNLIKNSCFDAFLIGFSKRNQLYYLTAAQSCVIYLGVLLGALTSVVLNFLFEAALTKYIPFFSFSWWYLLEILLISFVAIMLITFIVLAIVQSHKTTHTIDGRALI